MIIAQTQNTKKMLIKNHNIIWISSKKNYWPLSYNPTDGLSAAVAQMKMLITPKWVMIKRQHYFIKSSLKWQPNVSFNWTGTTLRSAWLRYTFYLFWLLSFPIKFVHTYQNQVESWQRWCEEFLFFCGSLVICYF